jgi:uncharacterized membrane protein
MTTLLLIPLLIAAPAAAYLPIYPGPSYDPATGSGFSEGDFNYNPGFCINDSGTVAGMCCQYVNNNCLSWRAVRWDASGSAPVEMENLFPDDAYTQSQPVAMNAAGTVVGFSHKFINGVDLGQVPARWDGTRITELSIPALYPGTATGQAYSINDAGYIVGSVIWKSGNTIQGKAALRWDPSGP